MAVYNKKPRCGADLRSACRVQQPRQAVPQTFHHTLLMPSTPPVPPSLATAVLQRQLFPQTPEHAKLLRLLLAQDGSATRLCEALAGKPISVLLQYQHRTSDVPAAIRSGLGGTAWLERITTLHTGGVVLMDNLSYTRLDAVPDWFLAELDAGKAPIGYLLDRLCIQREDLRLDDEIAGRLWPHVGLPDPRATKLYRILTPDGPLMWVFETFRAGWVQWDTAQ